MDIKELPTTLRYLLLEAKKRRYPISKIDPVLEDHRSIYQIRYKNKTMMIIGVNDYGDTSYCAEFITSFKLLTHHMLASKNIQMPKTYHFTSLKEAESLWKKKFREKPVVLKPDNSALGINVFVKLKNIEELRKAASHILRKHEKEGLIQEYKEGKDLRIQAVGGKLFAACVREPANVIGDGKHSITYLIKEKNKIKKKYNIHNVIKMDKETKELLKQQKLTFSSIPKENQMVKLKKAANIGQGGDAIDVTGNLHNSFKSLIQTIAKTFSVKTFATDFIVKDETKPVKNSYLLEINVPCMWAHHHFAEGQKRNVAAALLDAYFFPESFEPSAKKYLIGKI